MFTHCSLYPGTMSALVEESGNTKCEDGPNTTAEKEKETGEEVDEAEVKVSAKVSATYIDCKKEDLIQYSEDEEKTFYKEAIVKFNVKPKSAREYLISKKMIQVYCVSN